MQPYVGPSHFDAIDNAWIQTYSGLRFDLLHPKQESICITDIAHALSNLCRFTGHVPFYSVAQHSVLVSRTCDPEDALWGLLHDAPEAYVGDASSPLKHNGAMSGYNAIEHRILQTVGERFDLPKTPHFKLQPGGNRTTLSAHWAIPKSVKDADLVLLVTEKRDLTKSNLLWGLESLHIAPLLERIRPWTHERAKRAFMERFAELTQGGHA